MVSADEAGAIRFREGVGFPSDLTLVRTAESDKVNYSSDTFGVPLSDAETAELYRRLDVQWATRHAMDYANAQPEFAGGYIDQLAKGIPVFLFTANLDAHRVNIAKVLETPIEYRVEYAERSLTELLAQQATIDSQWAVLKTTGLHIVESAILIKENVVLVGIDGLTEGRRAEVQERFGTDLLLKESKPAHADACVNGNNCRPIKGGLGITAATGGECTSGFVVKRSGTGALHLLTAGHCIHVNGGYDGVWRHYGNGFGRAREETWQPNYVRTADVGLTTIFSDDVALMTNKNYMHKGAGNVYSVVGQTTGSQQMVDMQACRYGRNGGHTCGLINALYANRLSCVGTPPNTQCVTVTRTIRVDFDSVGGDSGGPVYYPTYNPYTGTVAIALGTHVHSEYEIDDGYQDPPPWYGWYSPIDVGAAQFNSNWGYTYTLCTSAAC